MQNYCVYASATLDTKIDGKASLIYLSAPKPNAWHLRWHSVRWTTSRISYGEIMKTVLRSIGSYCHNSQSLIPLANRWIWEKCLPFSSIFTPVNHDVHLFNEYLRPCQTSKHKDAPALNLQRQRPCTVISSQSSFHLALLCLPRTV